MVLDPHKWLYLPMGCGCVLYPDPASDRIQLHGLTGGCTYAVLDEQGRVLLSGAIDAEQGIDVSALATGSYVLSLQSMNGSTLQRLKFVKQ